MVALVQKQGIRIAFVACIVGLLMSAGIGVAEESDQITKSEFKNQFERPIEERTRLTDPRDNVTVITTSPRKETTGSIIALGPEGKVLYYNETHGKYFDVDSAPGDMSINYVAGTELGRNGCPASGVEPCSQIVIERANLTTGEVTQLHETYAPGGSIWHDVDRLDDDRFLVADISSDSVYVLNTSNHLSSWYWDVLDDFPIEQGGQVSDWTHLNDVEQLDDGRVMVSLRNLDQVVFLDRDRGIVDQWTLGEDDNHSILYEQHNPDYIPPEAGGPAVIIADSENDRVVEYQRRNATWHQSWVWSDGETHWPRDADRLPSGNTLITDSNGNRVIEVNQSGEIVWSISVDTPYEAERLGTGHESANGRSASVLNLTSRGDSAVGAESIESGTQRASFFEQIVDWFKQLLPNIVVNGLLFIMPKWFNAQVFVSLLGVLVVGISWVVMEIRWSAYTVSVSIKK